MNLPKSKKINSVKYVAGMSLYKNKEVKIKLSANESALGPSPKAIKEYIKVSKNFKRYPETDGLFLRKKIAKKFNLDFNRIILGSGSDQIFELICKSFLNKNDEVIVPKYSFIIYRIYSKINGAKVVLAKENNYKVSIKNIISKVNRNTKIVFLANPNNPTGTHISKNELLTLRKKLRSNILLVIDDAYFEYVTEKNYSSGLKLFSKSKNVVVTRTFSKIYGLAGLRVGWAHSSKNIILNLNKLRPPFNVSRPALFAAAASLEDGVWLKKEIKHVKKWSRIFFNYFKDLRIETNKSSANFMLINFNKIKKNSNKIFLSLAKKGILLRKTDSYKIKNSLRVTISNATENKKFISSLKKLI